MPDGGDRRPIKARETSAARRAAAWLAARGVRPNVISLASIAFALGTAAAFVGVRFVENSAGRAGLFLLCILTIQARLICNLLDGMVAVEGGLRSSSGAIFNDLPDRIADPLVLIAAGYAAGGRWGDTLGWAAGVMAVLTAYVRVLGVTAGTRQYFIGPMAKQHRMAVMTGACALAALVGFFNHAGDVIDVALGVVVFGCAVTIGRRLRKILAELDRISPAPRTRGEGRGKVPPPRPNGLR